MTSKKTPSNQTPTTAPVPETLRSRIIAEVEGARRLQLAYVGIVTGLFVELDGSALPVEELAEAAEVDRGYLERWCDAATAHDLVECRDGRIALSELGAAFLPNRPGSAMPLALMTVLTGHMMERAAAMLPTGEIPGEEVLGGVETMGPWFGRMLEASFGPVFEERILPALTVFEEIGKVGGLVVDLGCGNGWYLRRLVQRYPALRGLGLDTGAQSIDDARRRAAESGLSERLEFREGDLHHVSAPEPAQMVVMNRALHHVWAQGPKSVMELLRELLAPGGAAVIWEPRWPDDPATLGGHPRLRGMSVMHLSEHLQGNRLLHPAEVEAAFDAVGMPARTHLFLDGTEMVVVARRPE